MATTVGVIGIASAESARYALFYSALTRVAKPPHTALAHAMGSTISHCRNQIAEQAIAADAEWIWYVDDDQLFPPDTLLKLLARNVDVVSGLNIRRDPPFAPYLYDKETANGAVWTKHLNSGDAGLQSMLATSAGCLLVRTQVLKALEPPYWRLGQIGGLNGTEHAGEDLDFCRRVRANGFKIWCDLDAPIGHFTTMVVSPSVTDGVWSTMVADKEGTPFMQLAAAQPPPTGTAI